MLKWAFFSSELLGSSILLLHIVIGPCFFFSDRLQVQQKTTATDYNCHRIHVLLPSKTHGFFPEEIRVLVKEKIHGFSFSAATLVLPRLPKNVC
jgi:hypothetical protein